MIYPPDIKVYFKQSILCGGTPALKFVGMLQRFYPPHRDYYEECAGELEVALFKRF